MTEEQKYEQQMKELMKSFMNDSLKLTIQVKALNTLSKVIYEEFAAAQHRQGVQVKKFDEIYKKMLDTSYQETIASHAFLDKQWKEELKKDIGDVSGVALS